MIVTGKTECKEIISPALEILQHLAPEAVSKVKVLVSDMWPFVYKCLEPSNPRWGCQTCQMRVASTKRLETRAFAPKLVILSKFVPTTTGYGCKRILGTILQDLA